MIRSTTPKQSFFFEENPDTSFKEILITYMQNGKIVLEKSKEDLTFEETVESDGKEIHKAWFRMTQTETKMFSGDLDKTKSKPVKVQVKVLTQDDLVFANEIKVIPVTGVLNDSLMGEEAEEANTPPVVEPPVDEPPVDEPGEGVQG